MKLPSLQKVSQEARITLARFPLPLLSALVGTVALMIIMDHEGPPQPTVLWGLFFGGLLGIPLLTGATVLVEKSKTSASVGWSVKIAALLLVIAYACIVPAELTEAPAKHIVRLLLLAFAAHMFVAVSPFMASEEINGFWHYNKTLFLRILVAVLFAHIVFGGLAFALAALNNLFGLDIPGKRYAQLWVLVTGMFTTGFFLAGIPKNLDELDALSDYPKGLKVLAQGILLPIVLVYMVILYAYLGKILISWDWPEGWVSKLILGFSGTGIFSLLLLYPISQSSESVWVRMLRRWFFIILIPVVVMLFFAVWRRVSEYGVTEGRYLAFGLGLWLVLVIVYYLVLPRKSIKFIPASLCVLTLVVSFGPWGVFAVSEQSQASRLESLLNKNSLLVNGKVKKSQKMPSSSDVREIGAILTYLQAMHGYDAIQPWFADQLREDVTAPGVRYKSPAAVTALIGLEYVRPRLEHGGVVALTANKDKSWDIRGYTGLVRSQYLFADRAAAVRTFGSVGYRTDQNFDTLTVILNRDGIPCDSVRFGIEGIAKTILKNRADAGGDNVPPAEMCVDASSRSLSVRLCLVEVRLQRSGDSVKLMHYLVDILYAEHESL
jgi:hypothetical protein